MPKLAFIIGTRPDAIKLTPLVDSMKKDTSLVILCNNVYWR